MSERYDLIQKVEKKDGKTFWQRHGVMFAREKGGFSIVLNTIYGEVNLLAVPPKDDQQRSAPAQQSERLDDDIPFDGGR